MSADLRRERQRSKLNVEQLTNVFDGGEDVTNKRRMMGRGDILCQLNLQNLHIFYVHVLLVLQSSKRLCYMLQFAPVLLHIFLRIYRENSI